jgi:multiple sugar transport system substrate-binding protein
MHKSPKRNISRRDFLRMSAAATVGATLASCAPASPAPQPPVEEKEKEAPAEEKAPVAEKVTITYWDWWGLTTGQTAEMFEALVSDFAEIEPNIELNLQNVPFGEYFRKFLAAHAAGDVPDTMHCSTSWSRDFWDEGALVDLVPYMDQTSDAREQDFIPITLFAARKGPAIYGVPGEGPDHRTIFFNAGYFEEAGLTTDLKEIQNDWDWNTFTEAAKELTILEGEEFKRSGFLVGTPGYADIDTWAGCHGVESYKYEGGEITGVAFNDKDACVNGLNWYLDMLFESKVSQPIGPERQDWNQFVQGTTAMVSSGPWNYGRIMEQAPDMNWSAMLYPKAPVEGGHYSTEIWTNMLSIPAKAKDKDTLSARSCRC